jgi:diguanylate cyclase
MYSEYQESSEEAAQIIRQAVPLAAKFDLALNPIVYAVFYQYVNKSNPNITKELDSLIAKKTISQEHVERLYQTHIYGEDLRRAESINQNVGNIISATQGALDKAEGNTKDYSDKLNIACRQLNDSEGTSQLVDLVMRLQQETLAMQTASAHLSDELSMANQKIESMQLEFNKVRHESVTDPLTGLHNRRFFDKHMEQTCATESPPEDPTSLVLVDIDFFKHINDTYGHQMGDSVLKKVAGWLTESVRGKDVIARIGGEEFALVLPETNLQGASSVAENLRTSFAKRTLKYGDITIGKITISLGAAELKKGESADGFFSRADHALYQAKRKGRNRVELS